MKRMTILKISKNLLPFLFLFFIPLSLSAAPTDGGTLCVKLSKRYHYLKELNTKVNSLIERNRKVLKRTPKRKVSLTKRLDVLYMRLDLEKKKLKRKLVDAEINLAKKKCPDYKMLSRYNL